MEVDPSLVNQFFSKAKLLFESERNEIDPIQFNKFGQPLVAKIVETNDPLNMHRLRVKVPELHNYNMKVEDCFWARPAWWKGGKQAGSWASFAIDDLVYVMFEKGHLYSPIYIGSADPTRRARYVLDSVYAESPIILNEDGDRFETFGAFKQTSGKTDYYADGTLSKVEPDYIKNWLPKDRRPMSDGMKDLYGNCFIMKAVGFFPKSHEGKPANTGYDTVSQGNLPTGNAPAVNNPDSKYISLMTKYGNLLLNSDVGYQWNREFTSNWDNSSEERQFERKRTNYVTQEMTEWMYKDRDQRRIEMRTRYGHLIEMRDVGWNRARPQERGSTNGGIIASNKVKYPNSDDGAETVVDHRWIKIRTKGGHLFQMYDKGLSPESDNFIKKMHKNKEFGEFLDQECPESEDTSCLGKGFWHDRQDARFLRLVSRYGFKFVIDDRGASPTQSEILPDEHGNGILLKGRRKGLDGVQRGFGVEFNEKDELNHLMLYSPKSAGLELNDRYDYIMLASPPAVIQQGEEWILSEKYAARGDNEFSHKCMMADLGGGGTSAYPEIFRNHLKLDHKNNYIRLKAKAIGTTADEAISGVCAGLEIRGGPTGGCWTELVDYADRGVFMTGDPKTGHIVFRSEGFAGPKDQEPTHWLGFKEQTGRVFLFNNGTSKGGNPGKTIIYTKGDLEIVNVNGGISMTCSGDFNLNAGGQIKMTSGSKISNIAPNGVHFGTGGGSHQFFSGGVKTSGNAWYDVKNPASGGSPEAAVAVCKPGDGELLPSYKPNLGELGGERGCDDNLYPGFSRKKVIWNDK